MKRIKRIIAVLLVAVMAISMLAGCKASKQTMFSVMEDASSMKQYSYKIEADIKSDVAEVDDMTLTISGETDGNGITMGIKVDYLYLSVEVKDLLIVTKDALYLNVGEILSVAKDMLGGAVDFSDLDSLNLEWLEFPMAEGMVSFETNGDYTKLMTSILEESFKDVTIESKKGVHTATIDGMDGIADFVDNYITAMLGKKDEIIDMVSKQMNVSTDALTDLMELYVDAVVNSFSKFNKDYELGLTEEDIKSMREEADAELANMDFDSFDDIEDMYKELFDELDSQKDDVVNEIRDAKDSVDANVVYSNELTGKNGSREYTCNLDATLSSEDEEIIISVKSEMTEESDIKVGKPDNCTSFEDFMYTVYSIAYEYGAFDSLLYGESASEPDVPQEQPTDSSQNEETYTGDGFVSVEDWYDNSVTIYFDTDKVRLDEEYSSPEYGSLCFDAVKDEFCYLFLNYDSSYTIEDYYAMQQEWYGNPEIYNNVEFSEIASGEINGLTAYSFSVNYVDSSEQATTYYHVAVEVPGRGLIYTEYSDADFSDGSVMSVDDMLEAIFQTVE